MSMKPDDLEALRGRLRSILRCERVTRVLCRRSGDVNGFKAFARQANGRAAHHRNPPLPFHSTVHKGGGWCRVCGQPIYGGGSFRSFAGPQSKRLTWHSVCTTTYFVMTKPGDYTECLILMQGQVCPITGEHIPLPYREIEADHAVPLYRVARDHADEPWHELLRFWMTENLRALTRQGHLAKCAEEARERARHRVPPTGQEVLL